MAEIKLIVGLGNPGSKYVGTRHNVGFEVLNLLAEGEAGWKEKFNGSLIKVDKDWGSCWLFKPMAYMNLSGEPVRRFMEYYGLSLDEMVVAHDDVDMDLGRIKIVKGGGDGGHKGVRSIIEEIGSDFIRVKIGVGKPDSDAVDVSEWVLSRFNPKDREIVHKMTDNASEAIKVLVERGLETAQNRYNRREQ